MSHVKTALIALSVLLIGACSAGHDSRDESLSLEPPWDLDTIDLTDDEQALEEVLNAMPPEIDGAPADRIEGTHGVSYGTLFLRTTSLQELSEFSGDGAITVVDFLSVLVDSGELEDVESNHLDAAQSLVWVAGTSSFKAEDSASPQTAYVASWAEREGQWIFSVTADSSESRTRIVHAFIDAVRTIGEVGSG